MYAGSDFRTPGGSLPPGFFQHFFCRQPSGKRFRLIIILEHPPDFPFIDRIALQLRAFIFRLHSGLHTGYNPAGNGSQRIRNRRVIADHRPRPKQFRDLWQENVHRRSYSNDGKIRPDLKIHPFRLSSGINLLKGALNQFPDSLLPEKALLLRIFLLQKNSGKVAVHAPDHHFIDGVRNFPGCFLYILRQKTDGFQSCPRIINREIPLNYHHVRRSQAASHDHSLILQTFCFQRVHIHPENRRQLLRHQRTLLQGAADPHFLVRITIRMLRIFLQHIKLIQHTGMPPLRLGKRMQPVCNTGVN